MFLDAQRRQAVSYPFSTIWYNLPRQSTNTACQIRKSKLLYITRFVENRQFNIPHHETTPILHNTQATQYMAIPNLIRHEPIHSTPSSLDLVNSIMPPQRRRIMGIQSAGNKTKPSRSMAIDTRQKQKPTPPPQAASNRAASNSPSNNNNKDRFPNGLFCISSCAQ